MIVLEGLLLFFLLFFGIFLLLIKAWNEYRKPKPVEPPKLAYVPPESEDGGPKRHFRLSSNAPLWIDLGCPSEIGTQVHVNMSSGRIGTYVLKNIDPMGRDDGQKWSWYDFEFVCYEDSSAGSQDGPVSAVEH